MSVQRRRHVVGRAHRRAARPASAGPRRSTTTATPTASTRPSASPTPTRRRTCPCSRPPAIPVAVNPETKLAAIARSRGWLVEHWDKRRRRPPQAPPDRPLAARTPSELGAAIGRSRHCCPQFGWSGPVKALLFERKVARYAAAAVAGRLAPGRGARVGPLRLADVDPPELPGAGLGAGAAAPRRHLRVRPRHHRRAHVALLRADRLVPVRARPRGRRRHRRRPPGRARPDPHLRGAGHRPAVRRSAPAGEPNLCERIAFGHLEPGLQTGFCESTGGGWSTLFVAHERQLVDVPDDLTDEQAVLVEPMACAVHAARRGRRRRPRRRDRRRAPSACSPSPPSATSAPAVRSSPPPSTPTRSASPTSSAPTSCASPGELARHVRSRTGSWVVDDRLTGGAAHVVDCVGSGDSLQQALDVVAPGGTVHAVGMPGVTDARPHRPLAPGDRAARLLRLRAATTSPPPSTSSATLDLGRLVSATYPLPATRTPSRHAAERRPPWRRARSPSTSATRRKGTGCS